MGLLNVAAASTDKADLLILANVETIRDQQQPSSATAVAALIGGAPALEVYKRMERLRALGCLERSAGGYQLPELGAELLRQELVGWSPSTREDRRRERELMSRSQARTG
jgi:hypothetical protein